MAFTESDDELSTKPHKKVAPPPRKSTAAPDPVELKKKSSKPHVQHAKKDTLQDQPIDPQLHDLIHQVIEVSNRLREQDQSQDDIGVHHEVLHQVLGEVGPLLTAMFQPRILDTTTQLDLESRNALRQ